MVRLSISFPPSLRQTAKRINRQIKIRFQNSQSLVLKSASSLKNRREIYSALRIICYKRRPFSTIAYNFILARNVTNRTTISHFIAYGYAQKLVSVIHVPLSCATKTMLFIEFRIKRGMTSASFYHARAYNPWSLLSRRTSFCYTHTYTLSHTDIITHIHVHTTEIFQRHRPFPTN